MDHDLESRSRLLLLIDSIKAERLEKIDYKNLLISSVKVIKEVITEDKTQVITLIEAVKQFEKPCFKRDTLLTVIEHILVYENSILNDILFDTFSVKLNNKIRWKVLANAISSIPDLYGNCKAYDIFPNTQPSKYVPYLLDKIYETFRKIQDPYDIKEEQKLFYIQLIGRVALNDGGHMTFDRISMRVMNEENSNSIKLLFNDLIKLPLKAVSSYPSIQVFMEPLYLPFFTKMIPIEDNGHIIRSLLGDVLKESETLEYLICNKTLLQRNYMLDKVTQYKILFNVCLYLVSLIPRKDTKDVDDDFNVPRRAYLQLLESWSNRTKILLRNLQHNKYITCALVIYTRYLLKDGRNLLLKNAEEIQSKMMKGVHIYLDRACNDHHQLGLCIAEFVLPKIHELIDSQTTSSNKKDKQDLKFNHRTDNEDETKREIKQLFELDISDIMAKLIPKQQESINSMLDITLETKDKSSHSELMKEFDVKNNDTNPSDHLKENYYEDRAYVKPETSKKLEHKNTKINNEADINQKTNPNPNNNQKPKDNSKRGDYCDDSDEDDDTDFQLTFGFKMNAPIYLSDCVDGLRDNDKPRYVKLCLLRAGVLLRQISKQQQNYICAKSSVNLGKQQKMASIDYEPSIELTGIRENERSLGTNHINDLRIAKTSKSLQNDAIKDIAIELAQVLLYLDDLFNIDNFNYLRIDTLTTLCLAEPDIVSRFLLDEFNGTRRNFRHQLEILQVLVGSARQLSDNVGNIKKSDDNSISNNNKCYGGDDNLYGGGGSTTNTTTNRFNRLAPVYFYGIVDRLKVDFATSFAATAPSTLLSLVKETINEERESMHSRNRDDSMLTRIVNGLGRTESHLTNSLPTMLSLVTSQKYRTQNPSTKTRGSTTNRPIVMLVDNDSDNIDSGDGDNIDNDSESGDTKFVRNFTDNIDHDIDNDNNRNYDVDNNDDDDINVDIMIEPGEPPETLEVENASDGNPAKLDSSYLLSRIIFSLSIILECVAQQPIVCRLSQDLLDYLVPYRDHADPGVRKSIWACLCSIRSATPRVYFEENMADKIMSLFSEWLQQTNLHNNN